MTQGEFDWDKKPYYRPTDPETSKDAAGKLNIKSDSWEALEYFVHFSLIQGLSEGLTAAEFELAIEDMFFAQGQSSNWSHRRAESLGRRLTDLEKKFRKLEVRYNQSGHLIKRNNRQIYFLL